jgi:diacylglycerol kinase family enzyme
MRRVAILSNAGSGRNRRKVALLRALEGVSQVDQVVTTSADETAGAIDALLARDPDVLAVNGGDGTVQHVLTHLATRDPATIPPLAVLPAGSTNMTAHDLGCGGRARRRLQELLALRDLPAAAWPVETRRPVQVTDADGAVRLGFFFGMGTIVRGVEFWHGRLAHGAGAGEWGAGAALVRAAWGIARREPPFAEPVRVGLAVDDGPAEPRALMFALVTTMRRLFLDLTPFWGPGPGPLALTWVDAAPRRFLAHVPSLLRGRAERLPEADGFHGRRPGRVVLDLDESWIIDGEVFPPPGRLVIEPGPELRFLRLGALGGTPAP